MDGIDICKIDIEGAEKEVFADPSAAWYEDVGLFIRETHDGFAKGSDAVVKQARGAALSAGGRDGGD